MTRLKSPLQLHPLAFRTTQRCPWHWLVICCFFLTGCGKFENKSSNSPTPAAPPTAIDSLEDAAARASAEPSTSATAPGGLELPPGDIAPAPTQSDPSPAATGEGGIEMPAGVDLQGASSPANEPVNEPVIEFATWDEIQSAARSTGRITVVDLWSLACEPCLKEFPGLVRLHQSKGESVQCMAVDLDFDGRKSRPPETYRQEVVAFLQSVGAQGFPLFISTTPSDDVFASAKLSSIPAVLVFDAKGELVKSFVDAGATAGFTYEKDIIPFVNELAN